MTRSGSHKTMSALRDIVTAVTSAHDGSGALEYIKGGHATGEGDRYEERMLALVFLRCLRRRLLFQLSANNDDAGKFDDVVLVWRPEGHLKTHALLVQLKHKTSTNSMTLRSSAWLSKVPNSDFGLGKYCTSYKKISGTLEMETVTFVLLTNARLGNSSLSMFEGRDVSCVAGLDLLVAGGDLYKLNPNNQQVWEAVDRNTGFVEHFYLLCRQRNSEQIVDDIYEELEELLGAGDLCEYICDSLCKSLREWMNTPKGVCLTTGWSKWQALVDEYVRKEVTGCKLVTTKLKYRNVEAVRGYVESCNPAWVRPLEKATAALSATKIHQALGRETHIMVAAEQFSGLRHQILHCWGPFCRWLVIVDDDREGNSDIFSELEIQIVTDRRLIIVSSRKNNGFVDSYQSSDVSDDSWEECLDVKVGLNGDRYECRLRDLVAGVDTLKPLLDDKPAALLALARLSQPLRIGRELEALPAYYVPRQLVARWLKTGEVFPDLGGTQECARDQQKQQSEAPGTSRNVVIVEGRPGVGKSKMLSHVAVKVKERDPTCWLLRVNLLEFYTVFDDCSSAASAVEDILLQTVFNEGALCELEYALLRHNLLQSSRVVCLVDGFDEVCPDYEDICLEVLPLLSPRLGKLLVTTRPVSVRLLKDRMDVSAHSLEPFSKSELQEFFRHHPSKGNTPSFSGLNKNMRDLLRIPLFTEMFADLTQEKTEMYDIVTLYEAFFRNKFRRLYKEKWGDNLSAPGKKREVEQAQKRHEGQLMLLAASLLLRKTDVPAQPPSDMDYFVKTGIVYEFADGKPAFLHRTFAEHFLAKWCFVGDGKRSRAAVYREAYLDGTLEFFLESFDRMAVSGRPLLEAVLEAALDSDEDKVAELLAEHGDPWQTDACGRNALHLVAAYGMRSSVPLLRQLSKLDEGALSAVGGLLGWAPLRYDADARRWVAVGEMAGANGGDLSNMAASQALRHDSGKLQAVFRGRGYRALYEYVLEENHSSSGAFKGLSAEVEFAVSLISANMPKEALRVVAIMARKEGHDKVHRFLLYACRRSRKEQMVRRRKLGRLRVTRDLPDNLKNLQIGGQPQNASVESDLQTENSSCSPVCATQVPDEGAAHQAEYKTVPLRAEPPAGAMDTGATLPLPM